MPSESPVQKRCAAAQQREGAPCCPVGYDPQYLTAIPGEVIERDSACGCEGNAGGIRP